MPDGEIANSDMFVLPIICKLRARAIARHGASFSAGLWVSEKISEPAVVTTPFISMLSLTASRSSLRFGSGGQYLMKARLPGRFSLKGGKIEHPLHRTSEASTIGNHLKPMRPRCFMRATLDVCALFASAIARKHAPGAGWTVAERNGGCLA